MRPTNPESESLAQTGQTQNNGQYQLNVVLHGLWGIEANPDGIRLVTTDEEHHVIEAGDPANRIDLKPNKEYTLEGVESGPPSDFRADQNPTFQKDCKDKGTRPLSANPKSIKVAIKLPYPKPGEIHSVRTIKTNGTPFFQGIKTPPEIAIVQVLVYRVSDFNKLKLSPLSWTATPSAQGIINLHFFAQPDENTIQDLIKHEQQHAGDPGFKKHFQKAYENLAKAFGLTITPLEAVLVPPVDPHIPGLTVQDTIGLDERPSSLAGVAAAAGSPAACDMLVIDNTCL